MYTWRNDILLTAEGHTLRQPGATLLALSARGPEELEAPLAGVGGDGICRQGPIGSTYRAVVLVDDIVDVRTAEPHDAVRRGARVAALAPHCRRCKVKRFFLD